MFYLKYIKCFRLKDIIKYLNLIKVNNKGNKLIC